MSNYINVLRRLEREKRAPEPAPATVIPATDIATQVQTAPAAVPVEPVVAPVAQPVRTTVIPLPSTPPPPAPTPVVAPVRPEPVTVAAPQPVAPQPIAAQPAPPAPVVTQPAAARPAEPRRTRVLATEAHPGIANLLDRIRALTSDRAQRVVVFSGASTGEAVSALAGNLATHAERCGMRAFIGSLVRTTAGWVIAPASPAATTAPALGVDLDAGIPEAVLLEWVERVAPGSDLVVLTGPPLATSIEAALLACASDGLVIVAESEVTERAALQTAADRARLAGCRTLGVVMHGTKDRVPGWIRRIVGDRPAVSTSRED
jgi:Mrp family chromosome partitioning ATPase